MPLWNVTILLLSACLRIHLGLRTWGQVHHSVSTFMVALKLAIASESTATFFFFLKWIPHPSIWVNESEVGSKFAFFTSTFGKVMQEAFHLALINAGLEKTFFLRWELHLRGRKLEGPLTGDAHAPSGAQPSFPASLAPTSASSKAFLCIRRAQ